MRKPNQSMRAAAAMAVVASGMCAPALAEFGGASMFILGPSRTLQASSEAGRVTDLQRRTSASDPGWLVGVAASARDSSVLRARDGERTPVFAEANAAASMDTVEPFFPGPYIRLSGSVEGSASSFNTSACASAVSDYAVTLIVPQPGHVHIVVELRSVRSDHSLGGTAAFELTGVAEEAVARTLVSNPSEFPEPTATDRYSFRTDILEEGYYTVRLTASIDLEGGELEVDGGASFIFAASVVPGDLVVDGVVDSADMAELLRLWGTDDDAADLDDNGVVDAGDMSALLANWSGG